MNENEKTITIFPSWEIFELSAWQHSPKVTTRVKMGWRGLGQLTTKPMILSSNRDVHGKKTWKRNSRNKRRACLINSHENENPPQYSHAGKYTNCLHDNIRPKYRLALRWGDGGWSVRTMTDKFEIIIAAPENNQNHSLCMKIQERRIQRTWDARLDIQKKTKNNTISTAKACGEIYELSI